MQIVIATQSKLLLQGEMELSEYILKNEDQSCESSINVHQIAWKNGTEKWTAGYM